MNSKTGSWFRIQDSTFAKEVADASKFHLNEHVYAIGAYENETEGDLSNDNVFTA
jgi:hypothetical protein